MMTRDDLIAQVRDAFADTARPDMFIRGTCSCEECAEHEETMQSFTPDDLPLDKLDNPGWDPICFASDEAFLYLLPGLARLVLCHSDDYVQQFAFHLDIRDLVALLTPPQAEALLRVLDFLAAHEAEALDNNLVAEDLAKIRAKLVQSLRQSSP